MKFESILSSQMKNLEMLTDQFLQLFLKVDFLLIFVQFLATKAKMKLEQQQMLFRLANLLLHFAVLALFCLVTMMKIEWPKQLFLLAIFLLHFAL